MIEDLLPTRLLIVAAKLPERLHDRIGLSSILACVAAGILLGAFAEIVEPASNLQVFLSFGVFILFLLVGLDKIDIPGSAATIRGRFFCAANLSVGISIAADSVLRAPRPERQYRRSRARTLAFVSGSIALDQQFRR